MPHQPPRNPENNPVPKGGIKGGASPSGKKTPPITTSPKLARPNKADGTRIMRGRSF